MKTFWCSGKIRKSEEFEKEISSRSSLRLNFDSVFCFAFSFRILILVTSWVASYKQKNENYNKV